MSKRIITKIVLRNDSTENWQKVADTAILLKGEVGIEHFAAGEPVKIKVGDGVNVWRDLPYFGTEATAVLPLNFTWNLLAGTELQGETETTEKLGLVKPAPGDVVDITILNANMDSMESGFVELENNFNEQIQEILRKLEEIAATPSLTHRVDFCNENGDILNTQFIKHGEAATDPVAAGLIEAPTKETDDQYEYFFSGWDGNLETIIASTVFKPVFEKVSNTYTVRFYNDDKLLETKKVTHGEVATYSGNTSAIKKIIDGKEDLNYEFLDWAPSIAEPITKDTDFKAQFVFTGYIVDSWEEILQAAANGETGSYGIGGRKEIEGTNIEVEVVGKNIDTLVTPYENGKEQASLTFIARVLWDTPQIMNNKIGSIGLNSSYNTGGFSVSTMRAYLEETIWPSLPEELRAAIKPVYKQNDQGYFLSTLRVTEEKLWIPSDRELNCEVFGEVLPSQGEPYPLYTDNESRKKTSADGSVKNYWTRSTSRTNSNNYRYIDENGNPSEAHPAKNEFGIAFGFCI